MAFTQNVMERVAAIPGAQSTAIGNGGLPFGGMRSRYSIDGQAGPDSQPIVVGLISGDYGRTLGIPLVRGRGFTAQDVVHAEHVALINQAARAVVACGRRPGGTTSSHCGAG